MKWYMICPGGEAAFPENRRWIPKLLRQELPEDVMIFHTAEELHSIHHGNIVFCLHIDHTGILPEWMYMLQKIRSDAEFFHGSTGMVIVDGDSEFYTKQIGRELVFSANCSGCAFPGRPLVEGTGSLRNFQVNAKNWGVDLEEAYRRSILELIHRPVDRKSISGRKPRILVLHASIRDTSNTMRLWNMVKENLKDSMEIRELSLRNGQIYDCGGCPFTMCMHFSEKGSCYYGGVIVEQVYPEVERCDALVLLCPNYNDAVSANISAFINRLTALYRRRQFYDKYIFGVIVSGYSGGDILARQLISSLNMNKTFCLPPYFAMLETANDPGSILKVDGINEKAKEYADNMKRILLP